MFGSDIMAKFAVAAKIGGAVGLRANTPKDCRAIRAAVPELPLIGLWKVVVPRFEDVYITPRFRDALAIAEAGAQIIAIDATLRPHPEGSVADLIALIKKNTDCKILADIDDDESAIAAIAAGADAVSTTLSGYTPTSPQSIGPDFALIQRLAHRKLPVPIFAEGRIATPEDARIALDAGAWSVVVGGAITRPAQITARFAAALLE
jgi:N-acylglucosamine-6-phosphate 2-epimerase